MSKNLTSLIVAGLLANGCIITTGGTVSDSDSTTSNTSTSGSTGGSSGGSTGGSSGGSTGATDSGSTSNQPTTDNPTSSSTAGSSSTGSTTGSDYGNCGWNAGMKYYGCDGRPGVSDPDGVSPIDCPMELPTAGDKCDETSPVNNVGCCLPDGTNYYCDADGMIQVESCG